MFDILKAVLLACLMVVIIRSAAEYLFQQMGLF